MPGRPLTERLDHDEEQVLRRTMLRINEQGWGIAIGLVLGLGLFFATNVLVLRGGEAVGPHLSLLGVYLPGYRVTFAGSLIGFVYAFVIGYGIGRTIGAVYNRITHGTH
ncbi:MAG: hypothetical protein ACT4QD_12200 [Acidobacteriota bacterium]